MEDDNRLIFVCETGTARAHMAAEIMRREYKGDDLEIMARGLVVLFPEPINEKAEAVMVSNGIDVTGLHAQPLTIEESTTGSLIIAMTAEQKRKASEMLDRNRDIYTLKELTGDEGDVMDPYGGPLQGYGKCFEEIESLVKKLVQKINGREL